MLRNLAAALALVLISQTALGLGLGSLKRSSALNEPFDGRIEILGVTADDLDAIKVRLADTSQFERAGVHRGAVLLYLRFKVVDSATGADYVHVTSHEPIREPFLNFLLELNWANGRMVREYTVLLDPPLYDPARRRVAAPAVVATPAPPVVAKPAPRVVVTPEPLPAAVATSPSRPVIATAATRPPMARHQAMDEQPEESTPVSSYSAESTLRPVEANDTLWSIASASRPTDSISVQQMMLALLRANPDAFGDTNINILKRGSILRLPDDAEINALTRSEAIAEVKRQHQLWNDYRDIATDTVADVPLSEQPSSDDEPMADSEPMDEPEPMVDDGSVDTETAAESDARLELVAPGDGDAMGAGASDDGAADITLAREELDAQVQENAELQARIAEANEIIDLMSRQVDIRDDELAALQARLLELGIEAPADVVAGVEADIPTDTDEAVDDEPMVDDGADAGVEMGSIDDEVPVTPDDVGDVDITIGDDLDMAPDDVDQSLDDSDIAMDEGGGTEPDTGGSFLGGLIPQHITNMVPGGAMTILGVLGLVLMGAIAALFKFIGGRSDVDNDNIGAVAAIDEDTDALTKFGEEDEPITETREAESEELPSEDTTEFALDTIETSAEDAIETSADMQTLEAAATELAGEEPEEDPLEEVNVYLAYERFDQAEELVRKVIQDHPDEHKYKLRLLEVFYSSNNQVAYEVAAQELHDCVGESDPLWESTVAMWTEMSPTRALFAEGAPSPDADAAASAPQQVVDITADDQAGADTMSMAPGSEAALESTHVGLGSTDDSSTEDSAGSLDFDLGVSDGESAGDDIFDLTATTESLKNADAVLDLTLGLDESEIAPDNTAETQIDSLNVSATDDLIDADEDLLDLTTPAPDGEHDLLDVTSTGLMSYDHPDDLLNVTSPGLMGNDEPTPDADTTIPSSAGIGGGVDFDLSDTAVPTFGTAEDESGGESDVFDITAPTEPADAPLDFDIGELEDAASTPGVDDLTLNISGGLDFDSTSSEADGESVELDIAPEGSLDGPDSIETLEMEAIAPAPLDEILDDISEVDTVSLDDPLGTEDEELDFDLSLQGSDLDDLTIGDELTSLSAPESDDDTESEIEFDLALEDTTEMDSVVIDETLELPKANSADESLEDLAKSMEESMADLDLGDADLGDDDEGEFDLDLTDTSSGLDLDLGSADGSDTETSLDFDLEDLDLEDLDHADTVALDMSGGGETTPEDMRTVIMPAPYNVEEQSEADEIDTKLNLAKAYIELGDNDGARSILDEVARDGSDTQQVEAQRLIDQLT